MIRTPVKPFPSYKWRWLSYAPTESLLLPPIFLGVLRVLARHERESPADAAVVRELAGVSEETGSPVNLARTGDRNLIRNSGQYWKGTGLLGPERGTIELTPLGRKLAEGTVTQSEFAAIMVQQTVLPNPWTYTAEEIGNWRAADLEIRPLALILQVMEELGRNFGGRSAAYLTPRELIRICIPLAGAKENAAIIAEAIARHRARKLNVSGWPDCIPGANDHRLAKEFLKFLANFGLCRHVPGDASMNDAYCLDELDGIDSIPAVPAVSIFTGAENANAIVEEIRHSPLPSIIERQRTLIAVLSRPGQPEFRNQVFRAYGGRCLLTGDSIEAVLEAAHIVPVADGGADTPDNGICLRVDVHRLFDSTNIRIKATGELQLSDAVRASTNYRSLPARVTIPRFVNPANISWRDKYT
jgi:HNH endonuclease